MAQICVNDILIEVEHKDIKNIHLSVYPPGGRVHISAPLIMSIESIRLYAITKLIWIEKQIEIFQNIERQSPRRYVSGENYYYKGQRYRLKVIYDNNISPKIQIRGAKYIYLYIRENTSLVKRGEILREWYRKELKELLPLYIAKWEEILNVKANGWEVKQMRTKWGSCNTRTRRLLFNLELMKKPLLCIEYIVVHELAHLLERNHNERYKMILNAYFPQWKKFKEELNDFIV